jgi:hypothetical protein
MAKKKTSTNIPALDSEFSLYELTDLFYHCYKYHNQDCLVSYDQIQLDGRQAKFIPKTLSRFQSLRRIEAARLGSRPWDAHSGVAKHKPNVSLGYLKMFVDYLTLPYKSILTDSDMVKIRINQKQFIEDKINTKTREALKLQAASNPNVTSNLEISDDTSDAFYNVMKRSKKVNKIFDVSPLRVVRDAISAYLHDPDDWMPESIEALDLVTEPQADYDPTNWSTFFIIRKMTAKEALDHIKSPGQFWNEEALKWALESSTNDRSILNHGNYGSSAFGNDDSSKFSHENFSVKSFYNEKSSRVTNVNAYYGHMLVVEAYYINKKGKVNKAIFFPSDDFKGISHEERKGRKSYFKSPTNAKADEYLKDLEFAEILFHRKDVFNSMHDAITIIPFDRSESSLERQRGYCHELFAPLEMVMRLDSSILNIAMLMGVPFFRNRNMGTDGQNIEDMEININGDMQDLGDRDFVNIPFTGDLNSMISVRGILLQHAASKAFLGGLDGAETTANGRGANLANLRLIRDGRIHKHTVEDFSEGLKELFTKMFKKILEIYNDDPLADDDVLLKHNFFDILFKMHGHPKSIFEFDKKDIVSDTGLPYWMELEVIRNGASHFGAAEMIIYSEIKQTWGDVLDQKGLQALSRAGLKSMLGHNDTMDILGDPRDALVTNQDQIYRASMENAAILGSVSQGSLNFEKVIVLDAKDDHVAHLTQIHLPKAEELIKMLSEVEVTPDSIAQMAETELDSRNSLILKVGALSNHISLHAANLERFGAKRSDINQLKEQTNGVMQAAEGLMNSLQISLRALEQKRAETEARLRNLSPENEVEKMKIEQQLQVLQAQRESAQGKLQIANKIADQSQSQHMDKQLTKARDREAKQMMKDKELQVKQQEIEISAQIKQQQQGKKDGNSSRSNK